MARPSWDALLVPHLYMTGTGSTFGGSFFVGCTSGALIYVTGSTSGGLLSIGCTPGVCHTLFLLVGSCAGPIYLCWTHLYGFRFLWSYFHEFFITWPDVSCVSPFSDPMIYFLLNMILSFISMLLDISILIHLYI